MLKIKKNIAILGSTGSIGRQVLEILAIKPNLFNPFLLSANNNYKLLYSQAKKFQPTYVVINSVSGYRILKKNLNNTKIIVLCGEESLCELMSCKEIDLVLGAIVGSAGLLPIISAISAKKQIALANKETLVVAGELIMRLVKKNGVSILPIDSEHSAIFQCLAGENYKNINRLLLTASGGPFLHLPKNEFKNITIKTALQHPNWSMGPKITIDSATLMNKGFELIEAYWLFGVSEKNIDIVVHPQSIIHSLVEFRDGSIKAQIGFPDMTIPILYALSFPNRVSYPFKEFDLANIGDLSFSRPDFTKFPHLKLAYECLKIGGTKPCSINAANEIAVNAFLNKKIKFLDMIKVVEKSLEKSIFVANPQLDDYLNVDKQTREISTALIKEL